MSQTTAPPPAPPDRPGDAPQYVRWFADLGRDDTAVAGGKGANLGELNRIGAPVPPGFVVLASAYFAAMDAAGVRDRLRDAVVPDDGDDPTVLARLSERCQELVRRAPVPDDVAAAVAAACARLEHSSVAVRSSATSEDTADASFAGMNESYTGVVGRDEVLRRVVDCWASMWSPRSLTYRRARHVDEEPGIAVVVQEMVPSEASGVMFTADPATGDRDRVVVEAAPGLGEVVVGGQVEPDTYVLDRTGRLLDGHLGVKGHKVVLGPGGAHRVDTDGESARGRVLDDATLARLVRLGVEVEAHYGAPQDVEFAIADDTVWLVQTRPITTLGAAPADLAAGVAPTVGGEVALTGVGAAPGTATGPVRVLHDPAEGAALRAGDVLVAPMTNPDWLPTLRRAAAIVTERGGITCHAAIVGRELGTPAVVGARGATEALHDGEIVTVDGATGQVWRGEVRPATRDAEAPVLSLPGPPVRTAPVARPAEPAPVTATLLYVNLALADRAEEVAAGPADGVGLLRAELVVADALAGEHPHHLVAGGRREEYLERMVGAVGRIARAFAPRPVVYRAIDFRTNEFRGLVGGEVEPVESNPMIGYRGCYRYVRDPDLFALDLETVRRVRDVSPNLHLMIPFVRTTWELEACLAALDAHPLGRDGSMLRWVMAEVPSVAYRIPEYAEMGIDGVSIGSNDLTQLVLGVDRDSELCAELFDAADAAVLDTIDRIVAASRAAGITSSLCGQAPSNDPGFAEHLVRAGITSISVEPGALPQVARTVARAEHRLLVERARSEGV